MKMLLLKDLAALLLFASYSVAFAESKDIAKDELSPSQKGILAQQLKLQNYVAMKERGEPLHYRTEPLKCYFCEDATTNEECNAGEMVTCLPTQTMCQTEVRVFNPKNTLKIKIKKGCKQERACTNNFEQNKKTDWPSTQCNDIEGTQQSVCRYCCLDSLCNQGLPIYACGPMAGPKHGSVTCKKNFLQAEVCTFRCDKCYRLVGSRVRMCLQNSLWSGEEATCVYDETKRGCELTCPAKTVQHLVNGRVECTKGKEIDSVCRFFCDKGFHLIGKRVLKCGSNRKWNGESPKCIRGSGSTNPCHVYAVFDFAIDGQLQCECRTGFRGNGFTLCEDIDECQEGIDACSDNADCVNTIGSYRCRCRPGYRGNGIVCGDVNECTSGEHDCDVNNGVCINRDGSYSCTCAPDYTGDGKRCEKIKMACPGATIGDMCLTSNFVPMHDSEANATSPKPGGNATNPDDSAVFSSPPEEMNSCLRVVDDRPSMIRESRDYERMNERLLRKLVASSNNTEVVFGPWIGIDDRLEPGVLRWRDGIPLRGKDFQPWAPGQPRMVDSDGFGNCVNLVSDPVGSHTSSFLWQITLCSQPTRYICETERSDEPLIELCLPLINIANGQMSCTDGWRIGSVCHYSCNEGYILSGISSRVTCQSENRTWDNEPPVCVRAVCSRPLMPPNSGFMTCTDENRENSVCTFSCDDGFSLHGNETVTCQRNLTWSSQRPCCRDDCPPYAQMNLILVLDSSRSINAENFQKIKTFAKSLYRRFEVSDDFTRVSVIIYNDVVRVLNNKPVFTSSDELDTALDDLPYQGAGTLIGKALNYVADNLVGNRPGAGDIVVVLTDGISHDDVYFPSQNLQDMGAHIVAVGVRHAWRYQLEMIASEPSDVNIVEVESYDDLDGIIDAIGAKVCHLSC